MNRIAVVGAGFSGAVISRELAEADYSVDVFDTRPHVAGNCHTQRDPESGVLVHAYGPHIFHTDSPAVWDYVRRFDEFMPYTNRVKAVAQGRVYSLPVNLLTINQFFGKTFNPAQAEAFLDSLGDRSIEAPQTFEQQALRYLGKDLYEAFFKGYTIKQWGLHPSQLPASILRRLPVRFNYDDNYYTSPYQGMPRHGYTRLVENILDHPGISLHLETRFTRAMGADYAHVFYSGPLDAWFDHCEGRLGYRTLDFTPERYEGDHQGNAVINYCDEDVPWTRSSEHKHFAPWETHRATLVFKETSRHCEDGDIPYYPIRLADEKAQLVRYVRLARSEQGVSFVGRLGTYRYLDMHVTIAEALDSAARFLACREAGEPVPVFMRDPLG